MRLLILTAFVAAAGAATITVHKSSSAGGSSVNGQSFHTESETSNTQQFEGELDTRFNNRRITTRPSRVAAAPTRRPRPRPTTRRTTRPRVTTRRPRPTTRRSRFTTRRTTRAPARVPVSSFQQTRPLNVPQLNVPQITIPTLRPFGTAAGPQLGNRFNNRRRPQSGAAVPSGGGTLGQLQNNINQIGNQLASIQAALGM